MQDNLVGKWAFYDLAKCGTDYGQHVGRHQAIHVVLAAGTPEQSFKGLVGYLLAVPALASFPAALIHLIASWCFTTSFELRFLVTVSPKAVARAKEVEMWRAMTFRGVMTTSSPAAIGVDRLQVTVILRSESLEVEGSGWIPDRLDPRFPASGQLALDVTGTVFRSGQVNLGNVQLAWPVQGDFVHPFQPRVLCEDMCGACNRFRVDRLHDLTRPHNPWGPKSCIQLTKTDDAAVAGGAPCADTNNTHKVARLVPCKECGWFMPSQPMAGAGSSDHTAGTGSSDHMAGTHICFRWFSSDDVFRNVVRYA